jgi:hypothetical protein
MGTDKSGASPYTHHCEPVGQCHASSRKVNASHVATSASAISSATTTKRLVARGHASTVLCMMGLGLRIRA